MLKRSFACPDGHWNWPISVSHKHGVRAGDMIFVGGQVDLDAQGRVQHADDPVSQAAAVMESVARVLAQFGATLDDLVSLLVFHVPLGDTAETALLAALARHLRGGPGVTVTPIAVPALAYPGMAVDIEAVAMRGRDGSQLPRRVVDVPGLAPLPEGFTHGLRCGQMVFVGAQGALDQDGGVLEPGDLIAQSNLAMERVGTVLGELGAVCDDAVKFNRYYVGHGTEEDWEGSALACAGRFREPGPAATGLPLPALGHPGQAITLALVAMLGEDGRRLPREHVWPAGHWDWPVHLPYKHGIRCGEMVYIGGQVSMDERGHVLDPDDQPGQTRRAMRNISAVLEGFGLDFDHVVKVDAFYRGGASATVLHENLRIRSSCFGEHGPASTGIPLPALAYEGMVIEIEIVAMA